MVVNHGRVVVESAELIAVRPGRARAAPQAPNIALDGSLLCGGDGDRAQQP